MSGPPFKAPFVFFGGKSAVASEVWSRLGSPSHYIEPFAGSLAVLLARPDWRPGPRQFTETVNDADGLLCNFWRAVAQSPDVVAEAADWPVFELDLHARHAELIARRVEVAERLRADPRWCDPELAGWWVWGQCAATLGNWCAGRSPGSPSHCPRRGVLVSPGRISEVAARLRSVTAFCGDWSKMVGSPSALGKPWHRNIGIFLDPPYDSTQRAAGCYAEHDDGAVASQVNQWALENGTDPQLSICVAGFDTEHQNLEAAGWSVFAWSAHGGLGAKAKANARRERLWFSPACIDPARQMGLGL